jgi:hypothetical protein
LHLEPLPAPERRPPPPPPPAALPPVAAACTGSALDLGKLAHAGTCDAAVKGIAIPASVTLAIEPATVTVRSGRTAPAHVVLTNTSADPVELVIADGCDDLLEVSTELLDGSGQRVDLGSGDECGMLRACGLSSVVIELPAGGAARLPFTVEARQEHWAGDSGCEASRSGAVARGSYDLVAYTRLGDVRGKVVVR